MATTQASQSHPAPLELFALLVLIPIPIFHPNGGKMRRSTLSCFQPYDMLLTFGRGIGGSI